MPLSKEQYDNYLKRQEMRDEYLANRITSTKKKIVSSKENWSKEDSLNKPRHHTNCNWFQECKFCFKCVNYNPRLERCQSCVLHKEDGICKKKGLHTEKAKRMLIKRPTIIVKGSEN